jgi:type VI secretion system protein ImpC
MSTEKEVQESAEAEVVSTSILAQAIGATKQTETSRAQELLSSLTEEALKGTVKWNKNITTTLNTTISDIDHIISKQLTHIMHLEHLALIKFNSFT